MRSFIRGIVLWLSIISLCAFTQACGQASKIKKHAIGQSSKLDDDHNPADGGIDEKNRALSSPASIEAQCIFQEEEPPQNIAYYGVENVRNPLLQEIGRNGLSRELAVQFALVNNPDLFAYYENLEIAYAGLIEAGLRHNPVVSASTRYPSEEGKKINKTYDIALSFLDYFLIPLRKRAALADLHVIEAEVAQKMIDLVEDVEIKWLEATITELKFAKEMELVELKEIAAQLIGLQYKEGNVSALKAREREIKFELALERLNSKKAEREVAREKLNRSLGLFGNETCFTLNKNLDSIHDAPLPGIALMERAAIENRPDLEVLRREIDAIAQDAQLKEWWTYSNIKVGISTEKESEGYTVAGPAIELEVPVFNYGQGQRAKFDAMLAQAQKRLLARAIEASSEVREFAKTADIHRSQLQMFENEILPNFATQIDSAIAHYNVMTLGVFALFDLKEEQIEAQLEQLDAIMHYEKSITELLHAVGGSFASIRQRQ